MPKGKLENKNEPGNRMGGRSIDISRRVSDNPFDILSSSLYKQDKENRGSKVKAIKDELKDDIFKELLTKCKPETEHIRDIPYGIFTKMKILNREEIEMESRRMYKFPFELDTKNDGSQLFGSLYSEYLIAIKSIFREYKKNGSEFYLKFGNDFFHFGSNLKITTGMKKILMNNDIKFKEESVMMVEGMEVMLVFDYIINVPFSSSFVIPFILSEDQFDNSISFLITLRRRSIVRKDRETYNGFTHCDCEFL